MFEKASRIKLRLNYCGKISVEDLWDLELKELDEIYGELRAKQKALNEESLLAKPSKEKSTLELKVNVVRHIVETKLAEAEARKTRAEKKLQKEKIAQIIQKKKDEGLENMSIEDLQKAMDQM